MSLIARFARAALAGGALLSASACGGLIEQLQSNEIAIATLLKTPDATNPETEEIIPGHTAFTLFFGSVDKSKIVPKEGDGEDAESGAFKGNEGATVTLSFSDAGGTLRELNIPDLGGGQYGLDSSDTQLSYSATATYLVRIVFEGKTYRLSAQAPAGARIAEFKDKNFIDEHPAGADFSVTRAGNVDPSTNSLAFVNLKELSSADESESWTNMPSQGLDFLRLVLADSPWRQNSFVVPGEHFKTNAQYLVTLTSVERGTSDGPLDGIEAMFPGSSFLVGVGAAGAILTEGQALQLPEE